MHLTTAEEKLILNLDQVLYLELPLSDSCVISVTPFNVEIISCIYLTLFSAMKIHVL